MYIIHGQNVSKWQRKYIHRIVVHVSKDTSSDCYLGAFDVLPYWYECFTILRKLCQTCSTVVALLGLWFNLRHCRYFRIFIIDGWVIDEWWTERDLDGNFCRLIVVMLWQLPGMIGENYRGTQFYVAVLTKLCGTFNLDSFGSRVSSYLCRTYIGRFHHFYRPRRPLERVEV
jgi:hypothetical protein